MAETPDEKVRSAGVRKAERLAVGMDTAGIVQAAKRSEIDSTSRVYVRTWQFDSRHATGQDAQAYFEKTYGGRLREGDGRIVEDVEGADEQHPSTFVVQVRLWTVDSEWKRHSLAEAWGKAIREERDLSEDDVEVVGRNSRKEHMLRAYGVLKIAS